MKIKLLRQAEADIERAIRFYKVQQEGLGSYFYNSILSDIESLTIYCGHHKQVKGFYRLLAKRFPFAIYYKFDPECIYIYAVLDCRQNPQATRKRLKQQE